MTNQDIAAAHRRLHPAGRPRRSAGALRSARGSRALQTMLAIQDLDDAAAAVAPEDRRADQGQPARRPRRARRSRPIFKREGGGFTRLDQLFDGELATGPRHSSTTPSGSTGQPNQKPASHDSCHAQCHPRHRRQALEPLQRPQGRRRHLSPVRHRADLPAVPQDGEGDRHRGSDSRRAIAGTISKRRPRRTGWSSTSSR